VSVYVGVS